MIVRQPNNTFTLLFSWRGTVLPRILQPMGFIMLLSAIVGGLEHNGIYHFENLPLTAFSLIGLVLSIFLGFKNTACYDRWWEARKLWGNLISVARHLDRDSRILPQVRRERVIEQTIVFANVLRDLLRQRSEQPVTAQQFEELNETQQRVLQQHINIPQYSLSLIQWEFLQALREGEISDVCYVQLNQHVHELSLVHTGCDRLSNTPIPFAYSVLLHRTVYIFCLLLPFSLGSVMGLATPLVVGLLTYTFLGLDALSTELEEPFGTQSNDLPLDAMVRNIEIDLLSGLGKPTPPPIQPQHNNLL
ncbi:MULTISPECIES: bestrophin family protein [unclassified Acinetobacter]|uniref:bestrophin family protein n=1 Tax=unclassified Acinetobacter TaxID=196816 RepID=UPI0035B9765A